MTDFISNLFAPKLWPRPVLTGFKILSVIFWLIIIYSSLTPSGPGPRIPYGDKLMHALAYASLAGALRLGWPAVWGVTIIAVTSLLGVSLEIGQVTLAQGRTGSLADAAANMFGGCLALAILYPFRKRG